MGRRLLTGALALALLGTACGGTGKVSATLKDFSIGLDPASASAGEVTFSITNDGPSDHEFVVFRTDLDPGALPTSEAGEVDEAGAGLTLVDEAEDIAASSTTDLTVDLEAGSYAIVCNVPGHYAQGMHTGFTVS